jgi:predicted oxidoreductase (fatty acid repression mutant protein)
LEFGTVRFRSDVMTANGRLTTVEAAASAASDAGEPAEALLALLSRRRSIRRLQSGAFSEASQRRILEAVRLTPAAYNLPSWHVVLIHEERAAFWHLVETAIRERLDGDRRERYLGRLDGFRGGVGVALIYEDVTVRSDLAAAWQITLDQAGAYAEQGLGMVQLALWLALTAEGLVASLQHWDWLLEGPLAEFVGLAPERYRLVATLPIGYAGEDPRPTAPVPFHRIVSRDRFTGNGVKA